MDPVASPLKTFFVSKYSGALCVFETLKTLRLHLHAQRSAKHDLRVEVAHTNISITFFKPNGWRPRVQISAQKPPFSICFSLFVLFLKIGYGSFLLHSL